MSTQPAPLQAHCVHPQVCVLVSLYNSIIITWSLSYLSNSFTYPLPWDEHPLVRNINNTGEEGREGARRAQGGRGAGERETGRESQGCAHQTALKSQNSE